MAKKDQKYQRISDCRNGGNGGNGGNRVEEWRPFSATQGSLEKAILDELVAMLQEHAVSYSGVTKFCTEAILGLNSEEISLAIIA
jgi:hypothetical protein